jgi:hypothetical protein
MIAASHRSQFAKIGTGKKAVLINKSCNAIVRDMAYVADTSSKCFNLRGIDVQPYRQKPGFGKCTRQGQARVAQAYNGYPRPFRTAFLNRLLVRLHLNDLNG